MSHVMRKLSFCICENKDADQLRGNSAFVFATWIVQYLYFINLKFQASSHLQQLYSLVCVRPGQNPHCWFSHFAAQMVTKSWRAVQYTIMTLNFQTGRSGQTVQTQIRLLLEEQSDQGLHCLLFNSYHCLEWRELCLYFLFCKIALLLFNMYCHFPCAFNCLLCTVFALFCCFALFYLNVMLFDLSMS